MFPSNHWRMVPPTRFRFSVCRRRRSKNIHFEVPEGLLSWIQHVGKIPILYFNVQFYTKSCREILVLEKIYKTYWPKNNSWILVTLPAPKVNNNILQTIWSFQILISCKIFDSLDSPLITSTYEILTRYKNVHIFSHPKPPC